MIVERAILLGIEHLEQRRRRIAAIVVAKLVDLVEQDHRIHRLRATHRLDDAARHRADVRAPMTANLRFVAHAAERHAHELAAERARDRSAERRLAHTWRPNETENRTIEPLDEREHADVVEHALLHVVEPVVILVEHLPRVRDVEHVVGALGPRQRDDPVEVRCAPRPTRATSATCRRSRRSSRRARASTAPAAPSPRAPPRARRCRHRLRRQLAMDRLELLLEVELALVLEQRATHVVVDLPLELEEIDLAVSVSPSVRSRAAKSGA